MGSEVGTQVASEVAVGAVLGGRYRIVRLIGRGGMGSVYEAVQIDLERPVAVKVLNPELARDAEGIRRFHREAKAAASLAHPSIVQVTDFRAVPAPAYLVMDLLRGESLAGRIRDRGRLPADRVAHIGMQVLDALEVAHDMGIVHRDIKPDNVFLTQAAGSEDVVKVLDFGVAKLMLPETRDPALASTALTALGAVVGTPEYMAPEQARGREVDRRTDLYALGASLYHALSGRVPFSAPSVNALLFAIVEDAPLSLSSLRGDLDPGLVAVIDRAMRKRPEDRYPSAAEFREALHPFVPQPYSAPRSASAKTTPTSQPATTTGAVATRAAASPPRRTGVLPLVALLAVGAAVAVVLVVRRPPPTVPPIVAVGAAPVASTPTVPSSTPSATVIAPVASLAPSPSPSPVAVKPPISIPSKPDPVGKPEPAKPTASGKPSGGKTAFLASAITDDVVSWADLKAAFEGRAGAINACYAAAETDPVDHQSMDYHLDVLADGTVGGVSWYSTPRPASLDPCVIKALSALHLPATKAGKVKIILVSRVK
ncbi:MAG: serine/threonine protein kinase [Myxococcales bacterium]|nr:serine/threonine protein kinase [Myxococcales bacterium]